MKTKFEKFQSKEVFSLNSVKGGVIFAGKTSTTTMRTVETTNDTDSNSGIEGSRTPASVPFE